jgi:hypothetical protein
MRKHTAAEHERAFKKYTETLYGGRQLLKKHKLSDTGFWLIKGEDKNCDWGGAHHEPDLGVFVGTLEDCIRHAIDMPGFWTWGAGGRILLQGNGPSPEALKVSEWINEGVREKALNKLTDEEKRVLGLI